MKKILWILFVFVLAMPFPVSAQLYPFKIYSHKEGLSQSVVQAMIQDSKGYLWFGTEDGLNRFDGLHFTQYGSKEGLSFTDVYSLESDDQNIYIGTYGGGFFVLNQNNEIKSYPLEGDASHNTIPVIMKGKNKEIYFVSQAGIIYKMEAGGVIPFSNPISNLSVQVNDGVIDSNNTFWIATGKEGLVHVEGERITQYGLKEGLKFSNLISIAMDSQENIWLGTRGNGVVRFDKKQFHYPSEFDLPSPIVQSVYEAPDKTLWFGTEGGVCHLIKGKCQNYTTDNGLPVNAVNQILQGTENHIWFGTFGGGVAQLTSSPFVHFTAQSGLNANLVFAIGEGSGGEILIGTDGGGLHVLKKNKISIDSFRSKNFGSTIFSVLKDSRKNLWIGSYNQGVTQVQNGNNKQWTMKNGLPSNTIRAIYEDSAGNIWFATEGGLAKYSDGKISVFKNDPLLQLDISDVLEDRVGHLWLGTFAEGVIRLTNGKTEQITTKEGLANNHIYSIFEDKEGVIWFGTKGGLSRWKGEVFTNYTTKEGLANNACYFVSQDDRGFLWIGTNQGLHRFDGKKFDVYTVHDGLVTNEFNGRASYKDTQGNLWFGHIKGVTKLDFSRINEEPVSPKIYLSEIAINGETIDKNIDLLHLPYHQNNFNFHFISPYFTSPENLKYRYILEGLDKRWKTSFLREVQYTSLSPGPYTFRVQAEGSGGIRSEAEATYYFVIHPPFWKTRWFILLVIFFLMAMIVSYYKYKTYQIRQKNLELEKVVKQRTQELEEEKNVSDRLICNILPADLVEELKKTGHTTPKRYDNVTILFSDFKGFTTTAATLPPEFLVGELDSMFRTFDKIIKKYGLEKIKTIGDSYMAAGGLPKESKDHAIRSVFAAKEMQEFIRERNKNSIIKWDMRIGIHSGTVVAGVVGDAKFTYDIWGDTVNIASRMESACEPGRINLSAFCYHLVKEKVHCEYRDKIEIKGKGAVDMYYLSVQHRFNSH